LRKDLVEKYWNKFISVSNNRDHYYGKEYSSWHFDNNKKSANYLAKLVIYKVKNGTASLYDAVIYGKEPITQIGDISIILDWDGNPKCIIETTKVDKYKYKDVPEKFAEIEGEGDKSLDYWKKVHHRFFTEESNRIGTKFTDNSIIICEQFKLIYI